METEKTLQASLDSIERSVRVIYDKAQKPGKPAQRFVHPKAHGLLRAEFQVLQSIPDVLRVGLFKTPKIYFAWIRFSYGSPSTLPDFLPNTRGMAIKLLTAPDGDALEGAEQDFLLSNYPVFFVRNASDFSDLAESAAKAGWMGAILPSLNPFRWRWRTLAIILRSTFRWAASVAELRYWSQATFSVGTHVAKLSAQGCLRSSQKPFRLRTKYLRDEIRERFARGEGALFEFYVQAWEGPHPAPVNDATLDWQESHAPFHRVALIRIPPQNFESQERLTLQEQMSFSPWHTLVEHAPLGEINLVRQKVYGMMASIRQVLNRS
jgi:catalase